MNCILVSVGPVCEEKTMTNSSIDLFSQPESCIHVHISICEPPLHTFQDVCLES